MTLIAEADLVFQSRQMVRYHVENIIFETEPDIPTYHVDVVVVVPGGEAWRIILESEIVEDTLFEVQWPSGCNPELTVYKKAEK